MSGHVSTEIDVRLAHDTGATIEKARELLKLFDAGGACRDRILIKIPATWEGIRAAELLEREGIRCHLTMVFGLHQAIAAAQAGVRVISVLVGRIADYHAKTSGRTSYLAHEDPGVIFVRQVFDYLRRFGFKTELHASAFRSADQVLALAGCDSLSVSPRILAELSARTSPVTRQLDASLASAKPIVEPSMDETGFRLAHERDRMAHEKLDEALEGFARAAISLEILVSERLEQIGGRSINAARELFRFFDLDGDGFITREEWAGSDAVFDALDTDGDGRISPDEMGAGLGAAFRLASIPPGEIERRSSLRPAPNS